MKDCVKCGASQGYERYDARGIYITRVCHWCWIRERKHYRPEVLEDPNYECDEPIEEEE